MRKILYITTVSRTVNAFLVPHIETLIKAGNQVDCACFIDKEVDKGLIEKGVKVYNIPFTRSPFSISNIKAFRELLRIQREKNYDVVHVHTPIASIYGRLLKLKNKNLKTIYTAHGYHFLKGGSKLGWLIYYPIEWVMAKLTDITININEEDYEITKNKLKPKKAYLINGVGLDLNKYKPLGENEKVFKRKELNLKSDDFIVLMIAELNENKNQIQLIKAMEILKEKYPNIKAICVGEGHKKEELQEEINSRGIQDNIKLLGFRTDINELINISDIGILLSYREGLPRNLMELMANGKKIIATNIRGCRDIVSSENVGRLVGVLDIEGTAKVIEEYYLIKDELRAFSKLEKVRDGKYIIEEIEKYDSAIISEILKDICLSI